MTYAMNNDRIVHKCKNEMHVLMLMRTYINAEEPLNNYLCISDRIDPSIGHMISQH